MRTMRLVVIGLSWLREAVRSQRVLVQRPDEKSAAISLSPLLSRRLQTPLRANESSIPRAQPMQEPGLREAAGEMIRTGTSVRRLQVEIAKCEVLCANCHQRHTITGKTAHYKIAAASLGPSWRQAANRRNAALVLEHLRTAACVDCGIADSLVLQFDHTPGTGKLKDIGWHVSSGSQASLVVEEIAGCHVRCANCHRRRTALAGAWFRARVRKAEAA
jgi:hypothetical protein